MANNENKSEDSKDDLAETCWDWQAYGKQVKKQSMEDLKSKLFEVFFFCFLFFVFCISFKFDVCT